MKHLKLLLLSLAMMAGSSLMAQSNTDDVKLLREAAERGDVGAQYDLAVLYSNDSSTYTEAVKWFREAARQGHTDAQYNVGFAYENGLGVEPNLDEAIRWYKLAAEQNNALAINTLGAIYSDDYHDYSEAIKLFRKAADLGCSSAQINMGVCYEKGLGVEIDHLQASEWYDMAADQGDPDGIYYKGHCYEEGIGVEENINLATIYYDIAAEHGSIRAEKALMRLWMLDEPPHFNKEDL